MFLSVTLKHTKALLPNPNSILIVMVQLRGQAFLRPTPPKKKPNAGTQVTRFLMIRALLNSIHKIIVFPFLLKQMKS